VILLLALAAGLLVGLGWAHWYGYPYQAPKLNYLWLVLLAFVPQFVVVYLPITRKHFPDWLVVVCLLASQILLFGFVWLNRRIPGMPILICGLVLNLAVMAANNGFMPISPQTASRLVSKDILLDVQPPSRFGTKDILLLPQDTRFEWLADRFLTPTWFPYQAAFSLGDVLIAIGTFWLLAKPGSLVQIKVNPYDSSNDISKNTIV
jgi:Family of unknown function (DUF5317)